MSADAPLHDVAVTVFLRVPGVDVTDAHHVAEGIVKQALLAGNTAPPGERPRLVMRDRQDREWEGTVAEVRETGSAALSGWLNVQPGWSAFRGLDQDGTTP